METKVFKIEEVLQEKGVYVGPTIGNSMKPMLIDGRDSVVVLPKTNRLAIGDVALYKRGDSYILHRIVEVLNDGYVIRGDNCYYEETVLEKDVIGVLAEYFQKDKHFFCTDKKYVRYAKKRINNYKTRYFFVRLKRKIGKIFTKK